jgi:circadian clock protein KaiB
MATAKNVKKAGSKTEAVKYVLKLYVTGLTPRSRLAIKNVRELLEAHLPGMYELEIVDIYQQPELAKANQLIAAPTLIKQLPLPLRRLIGDMSKPDRILAALAAVPAGKK